jgi:hypothetical protein
MIGTYFRSDTEFIAVFGQALFDEVNAIYALYVVE